MLQPLNIDYIRGKRDLELTLNGETWPVGIREGDFTPVSGTMRSSRAGEVIEWKDFSNGALEIAHNDVVVRNCYFTNKNYHTLYQLGGVQNTMLELSTFDGRPGGSSVNASNADFVFAHNRVMTIRQCVFLDAANDALNSVGGLIEKSILIGGGFTAGAHTDAISVHTTVAPFKASKLYIDFRQRPGAVVPNACVKFVSVSSIGQSQGAGNGIAHEVSCYDSVCIGGGYTMYLDTNYSKVERNIVDAGYWYGNSDTGDVYPPVPAGYKNNKNMADVGSDYVTITQKGGSQPAPGPDPEPAPPADEIQEIWDAIALITESQKADHDRLTQITENLHKV